MFSLIGDETLDANIKTRIVFRATCSTMEEPVEDVSEAGVTSPREGDVVGTQYWWSRLEPMGDLFLGDDGLVSVQEGFEPNHSAWLC